MSIVCFSKEASFAFLNFHPFGNIGNWCDRFWFWREVFYSSISFSSSLLFQEKSHFEPWDVNEKDFGTFDLKTELYVYFIVQISFSQELELDM